jgi:NADP-dependent 3-hydroxy acid dehydrogenase YdfG
MSETQKIWFITGTSTGFGRELAEQLLADGEKVVATARKPEQIAEFSNKYPETALAVALDVTDQASVEAAVKSALDRFGRVDVLVNNAAMGWRARSKRQPRRSSCRCSRPTCLGCFG